MQTLSRVADTRRQQGFDVHVNVLIVGGEVDVSGFYVVQQFQQPLTNGFPVLGCQDTAVREHFRVGQTSFDVLPVETAVKGNRRVKVVDKRVGLFSKASGP